MVVYSGFDCGEGNTYSAELWYHGLGEYLKTKKKMKMLREISKKHDDFSAEVFKAGILEGSVRIDIRGLFKESLEDAKTFLSEYDEFDKRSSFERALKKEYGKGNDSIEINAMSIGMNIGWYYGLAKRFRIENGEIERIFPER